MMPVINIFACKPAQVERYHLVDPKNHQRESPVRCMNIVKDICFNLKLLSQYLLHLCLQREEACLSENPCRVRQFWP